MTRRKEAAALRYGPGDAAPRVVAAGRGEVAQRILALAQEHGVPVYSDPALASSLTAVELGAEIPPELYRAVAEVLAFLYRMDVAHGGRRIDHGPKEPND